MTLIMEETVYAAKAEGTAGTVETLGATEGVFNAFEPSIVNNSAFHRRSAQRTMDELPGVAGLRAARALVSLELVGNGASGLPAWATVHLPACGFIASGSTYSPVTDQTSHAWLTIGLFEDGRIRRVRGCQGTFGMRFETGSPVMMPFEFDGAYVDDADLALVTPTFPTTIPPVFESGTFTVGGTAQQISECQIDVQNEITLQMDPSKEGGIFKAIIVRRNIVVTLDPEAALIATKDWYTDFINGTEAALNIVVGSASNNTMTVNLPQVQVTEYQPGDREGLIVDQLTMQANRNATAGDDAMTIAFS